MRTPRVAIGTVVGFTSGCLLSLCVTALVLSNDRLQARYHWWRLNVYLHYVNSPRNGPVEEPFDIRPSLASLVSLRELDEVDIVLPHVAATRDVTVHLNNFTRRHSQIVFATSNPTYTRFPVSGDQPLHLQLWFRPSSHNTVRELIESLESQYGGSSGEQTERRSKNREVSQNHSTETDRTGGSE